jgi:oxazoline/thiazoline synthase
MSQRVDSQARPRLRRGALLAPADSAQWQARFDFDGVALLEGEACRHVLPWLATRLDGQRTVDDLQKTPDCPCTPEQLREVLSALSQQGYLLDARSNPSDDLTAKPIAASIEALGADANQALTKVRAAKVAVCGRSPLAKMIADSLHQHGFDHAQMFVDDLRHAETSAQGGLSVVVETDFALSQLDNFNRGAISSKSSWMLVGAWNRRVLVGPIFLPGVTACYECYRRRLDSHRRHLAASLALDNWRRQVGRPPSDAPEPVLPGVAQLASAWTALDLFSYVSEASEVRTLGRVLVYEPDSLRLTTERVLRIPWCKACSPYSATTTQGNDMFSHIGCAAHPSNE